jgi:competence protein ComEA
MKTFWGIAFGIVIGLLAAGVILLVSSQPRGKPISLTPPPTPQPLTVHVSGGVANPGVYTLPLGSRVVDAIEAAGGLLPNANDKVLNLAAKLQDGQMIQVYINSTPKPSPKQYATAVFRSTPTLTHLININTASQEELESLPGIGPVLAQRIIKYRTKYGPFKEIRDILVIYDLTQETYELIKNLITVGGTP